MRLNGFDLNQIVCLDALLSERSVTRAAEQVYLSQSAVSTVLAQLRTHFDDPLLVRSGRTLVLTPFAKTLIAPLNEVLSRAQTFSAMRPGDHPETIDREIKIVASDYSVTSFLADAIHSATRLSPKLRFDILPLTERSSRLLASGEVDLLFAGQAMDIGVPPDRCLLEDAFVCLACATHGPKTDNLTQEEFLARKHVVVRYFDHQLTFEDEDALRKSGLTRLRQTTVWSHAMVPSMICGTPMLATIPRRLAEAMAQRWPIRLFPFPIESEPIRVFAYWHPSREQDAVVQQFLDTATQT